MLIKLCSVHEVSISTRAPKRHATVLAWLLQPRLLVSRQNFSPREPLNHHRRYMCTTTTLVIDVYALVHGKTRAFSEAFPADVTHVEVFFFRTTIISDFRRRYFRHVRSQVGAKTGDLFFDIWYDCVRYAAGSVAGAARYYIEHDCIGGIVLSREITVNKLFVELPIK